MLSSAAQWLQEVVVGLKSSISCFTAPYLSTDGTGQLKGVQSDVQQRLKDTHETELHTNLSLSLSSFSFYG